MNLWFLLFALIQAFNYHKKHIGTPISLQFDSSDSLYVHSKQAISSLNKDRIQWRIPGNFDQFVLADSSFYAVENSIVNKFDLNGNFIWSYPCKSIVKSSEIYCLNDKVSILDSHGKLSSEFNEKIDFVTENYFIRMQGNEIVYFEKKSKQRKSFKITEEMFVLALLDLVVYKDKNFHVLDLKQQEVFSTRKYYGKDLKNCKVKKYDEKRILASCVDKIMLFSTELESTIDVQDGEVYFAGGNDQTIVKAVQGEYLDLHWCRKGASDYLRYLQYNLDPLLTGNVEMVRF